METEEFSGCCGIEIAWDFPFWKEGDGDVYDNRKEYRKEVDSAYSALKRIIKIHRRCYVVALNENQWYLQVSKLRELGFKRKAAFLGNHGRKIKVFIREPD